MLSIDDLIASNAKGLKAGESISFTLVKGPSNVNAAATKNDNGRTQLAPDVTFPIVAKFMPSVTHPDFMNNGNYVMYEEDKAKARDSDDDEIEERLKKLKRKTYRRRNQPLRHWVLHDADSKKNNDTDVKWLSRYEGNPEFNTAKFAVLSVKNDGSKQINVDVVNGIHNFAQPHKLKALSKLSDASELLNSRKAAIQNLKREAQRPGAVRKSNTKLRLMDKLKGSNADVDDADDIMADVAFRNSKVSVSSRRELLSVSDDIAVDGEGVIGGANDQEFGGQRSFGTLRRTGDQKSEKNSVADQGHKSAVSNDGAAMVDDFYDRNIAKEYDDLDYNANEQFDDDDVHAGEEPEDADSDGGFAGDIEDQGDDDDDVDEDGKGFASSASFRNYLRRDEMPDTGPDAAVGADIQKTRKEEPVSSDGGEKSSDDDFGATDRTFKRAKIAVEAEAVSDQEEARFDADGFRTLTLDAVRKEIWLNHCQITMKGLNKIFNISKKATADRKSRYMEIVKELCTMKEDKTEGRVLVLKQHYQKGL